jgi:hypothetical protein
VQAADPKALNQLCRQGQYREAISIAKKVVAMRRRARGLKAAEVTGALNKLAF